MEVVVFWFAALLALAGALGVVLQRNPFYSVLVAGRAPDRAGGAVPAAAARSSSPPRR